MKRKIGLIISILTITVGVLIMIYPSIENFFYQQENDKELSNFTEIMQQNLVETLYEIKTSETVKESDSSKKKTTKKNNIDYNALLNDMRTYNESLAKYQYISANPEKAFNLTKYGVNDGILGYININKLNVTLPIRVGTELPILNKGAGNIIGTSLPIGGVNTNSVIAAHRGWGGKNMFRYINKLEKGDIVTISNYFGKLKYKVVGSEIIPDDTYEDVTIQKGKDMITLYTCHPYTVNTHRLIVRCERVQ